MVAKTDTRHLPERRHGNRGTIGYPDDDDLAQAIVIAEAAADGPLNPDDLGWRFWKWAEGNGLGIGNLTRDVLKLYGGDTPQCRGEDHGDFHAREPNGMSITEASRAAWQGSRAGNGAAMRCTPIAIRWCYDEAALVRNSIVSAVPTHWDRRCGWSCALLNLAAAAALRGVQITADELLNDGLAGVTASLSELHEYGYSARIPNSVREAVQQAVEGDLTDVRLDGRRMGYTLLALKVGLIAYWYGPTFEEALTLTIAAGGDTDTNGAVVGALLGARFGLDGIPQRWRDAAAEIRAGRICMESLADHLQTAMLASRKDWPHPKILPVLRDMESSAQAYGPQRELGGLLSEAVGRHTFDTDHYREVYRETLVFLLDQHDALPFKKPIKHLEKRDVIIFLQAAASRVQSMTKDLDRAGRYANLVGRRGPRNEGRA